MPPLPPMFSAGPDRPQVDTITRCKPVSLKPVTMRQAAKQLFRTVQVHAKTAINERRAKQ